MSTVPARRAAPQSLLLHDVDWQTYARLLRVFAERPGFRLTYDRGSLEIMSPSNLHEREKYLLGRFIDVLIDELQLPARGGESTTLRRRKKRRGLEPDKCYWIASEPRIRGKQAIDLRVDPPPDLAIEVDVTRSSLNRMSIYAALGVPEVWRLTDQGLTFQVLGTGGQYAASGHSLAFPMVAPADLLNFLNLQATQDDTNIAAGFRAWVRQRVAAQGSTPPTP
jgi:Uma2 family endonuclease